MFNVNTYRNKKTGTVICVPSPCQGGDWEPVEPVPAPAPAKPAGKRGAKPREAKSE